MKKDPKLIIHTTNPVNAEPPLEKLRENYITPQPLYYIRNHGEIPEMDIVTYRLKISGLVNHELELSLDDIKNNFEKHTVMATLQCAGNRRIQLIDYKEVPGEVPWQEGAIGNAFWAGARLKDILEKAGVQSTALYVEFIGADDVFRHGENVGFGASIPIEKALTDDVLIAYEMNGETLEPTHGYPVRALVPGYIGARSVKWLTDIILQQMPSKNYFQDHAYKLFPPDVSPENVNWENGIQLSELDINCVITSPKQGDELQQGKFIIEGWAMSGNGRKIKQVEISLDNGNSWIPAIFHHPEKWAWAFWNIEVDILETTTQLIARAIDIENNEQPENVAEVWNFKGYMNNSWHKIKIQVS